MAIVRLVVMMILMLNQILIANGWTPLPYDEEQIYEFINAAAMVGVGIWAWYKNNNVTKEAQEADEWLKELKKKNKK